VTNASLAPFVRSYFEDHLVCRKNVSRNTIQSYRDTLKLLLCFTAERHHKTVTKLLVAEITEDVIIAFLAHLQEVRANSIQTRNHRLTAIRGLFDYIAAREPLLLDHCRRIAVIPRKRGAALPEMRYLGKDQMTALLEAAGQNRLNVEGRDYTLLLFMYNTGARVQEVADLRFSWLTLDAPAKVELLGKGRKRRTCPLWDSTATHLRRLIECRRMLSGQDNFIFVNRGGHPLSRSGIADIVRRYVARAATKLPSLENVHVTPHTLRHTTAMHLLQSGVEVNVIRSWLGHVSIATTNRYIEIDLDMKAKAMKTCEIQGSTKLQPTWKGNQEIIGWLETL
jgi:integrase/recombinase XerD